MNKRLKIGLITHNFPNFEKERVNAGIFSFDLAKALSKNAEVIVFSPGITKGRRKIGGIMTYFFEFDGKLGSLKVYNPWHIIKFVNFFISGKKALNTFIQENSDINFMISMWAFPAGYFASYLYNKYKIPYAIYCLGSDIYLYSRKPFLKTMIRNYLRSAKFILADGIDLADKAGQLSGRKVHFLPSTSNFPVNKASDKDNLRKNTLTFLGRLEKVKGIDLFIQALNSLSAEKLEFQANIVGSGILESWVKQNKNSSRIRVWGNVDNPLKIAEIMRDSRWLVIPSRSDSIPLVLSEAIKMSLPVIVSDLPDLKYLVKKYKIGYTFKTNDAQDLTKVLIQALTDKKKYASFKANTTNAAEIFDLNKSSDKLLTLVKQNI